MIFFEKQPDLKLMIRALVTLLLLPLITSSPVFESPGNKIPAHIPLSRAGYTRLPSTSSSGSADESVVTIITVPTPRRAVVGRGVSVKSFISWLCFWKKRDDCLDIGYEAVDGALMDDPGIVDATEQESVTGVGEE